MVLLINPPVAKPCEPPAGLSKLAGALQAHGIRHAAVDANIEGLLFLTESASASSQRGLDTWTRRSVRDPGRNLSLLRDPAAYRSHDKYKRAVKDLNRALEFTSRRAGATAGLVDFQQAGLSPVRSEDLLYAAEHPEQNPFFPYFKNRLSGLLEEFNPSVIGFSLNYLSQAFTAFSMIGYVRSVFPEASVVLGGGLVTSWIRRPSWKNPFYGLVDRLVAGPGEPALLSMLGKPASEDLHITPDYTSFLDNTYAAPGLILPYSASSGCYWRKCSFCPENAEGSSYKALPPDRAITDLHSLVNQTRPSMIHLLDNAVSPSLMEALVKNPSGVAWYGFARFGSQLTDLDFCVSLRRSGCVMLKLGLESGDQNVLDRMKKGIDLKTASSALRTLKMAGIGTYVYLLFGTPEETEAGARNTLDFVVRHRENIGYLNLAIFNMPVGSNPAQAIDRRSFYEGDLSLYTGFIHPSGWERKAVRKFLENEFKRHKAVASIIRKDPPFFTSNHAPFFLMNH